MAAQCVVNVAAFAHHFHVRPWALLLAANKLKILMLKLIVRMLKRPRRFFQTHVGLTFKNKHRYQLS